MGTVLTILKNCFKWKSSDKYWETFPNKNRGDIRMYILSNVITVFYVISLFISIDFLYVIHRCSHIKQERVGEDKGRHGFYDYYEMCIRDRYYTDCFFRSNQVSGAVQR